MLREKVAIVLGPPLGGKSSFARTLAANLPGMEYFSVRRHFEPRRRDAQLALPPMGTMLPDDLVLAALGPTLREAVSNAGIVLDGFPGSVGQAHALREWLTRFGVSARLFWLPVSRDTAWRRAVARRVCVPCDGGVDAAGVDAFNPTICASCGAELGCRADDDRDGFARRWSGFFARVPSVLTALASPLVQRHGAALAAAGEVGP